MSHKVHPFIFRLDAMNKWKSRWFSKRTKYRHLLEQDYKLRDFVWQKLKRTGVESVEIEHTANQTDILIKTSRPGLVIGRGGSGIEELKKSLKKLMQRSRFASAQKEIRIEIIEVRQPTMQAAIVAEEMAAQIERRIPYRRVMKQALDRIMQNREVQGAKVQIKGRLNGNEIARKEWLKRGRMALQTLRSNIDYAGATAFTTYGTVGIKVWICKGEVFEEKK